MTKKILAFSLLTAIFLISCNEGTKTDNAEKSTTENTDVKTSDEIVTSSLKNKQGQTLDMTFNNTTNTAKIIFNGGEQIDLIGQQTGSGIWYKNENYELTGKGNNLSLTKDGKVIFEHQDDVPTTDGTNNEANNDITKLTQKEDMSAWWKGKRFENKRAIGNNPEEGGPDFLIINQDQTASYKVGDIV
ncbi:MAG: MliC family protein, partial [Saprospiraceae bacterium]